MFNKKVGVFIIILLFFVLTPKPVFSQLLDPTTLTKYIDPLPQPPVRTPAGMVSGYPYYNVHERQVKQKMHSQLDSTPVWTYDGVTPGPTFLVWSGQPNYVRYYNDLPANHLLPVDTTIHPMAGMGWGASSRTVTHLHGGDVPAKYDGWPLATKTPGQMQQYLYPNSQQAATLWYHDHAMGITRLNAYAGIAAFYIIIDPYERNLNLPSGPYEIGIALQDRSFYADGRLFYPADWVPEFFGDVAVINGVIWPKLEVDPVKYRVHLLAGGNDRFWNIKLFESDANGVVPVESVPGPAIYQIGAEQGLLPNTAIFNDPLDPTSPRLLMGPGERFDVVIDFGGQQGKYFLVHNNAKTPFSGVNSPGPDEVPLPELFLIHVKDTLVNDPSTIPMHPRPQQFLNPAQSVLTRDIIMEEMMDPQGNPIGLMLNGKMFDDPISEFPIINTIEIWRWVNTTGDVHPMHQHLVQFQVLDRTPFDVDHYMMTGEIVLTGPPEPPAPNEVGWKDTHLVPPGYISRTIARFNRLGKYVYHCHILAHEENEMMRPFEVITNGVHDAGVVSIVGPCETIPAGTTVYPTAVVQNFGGYDEYIAVFFNIGCRYSDCKWVRVEAGQTATVVFRPWVAIAGRYNEEVSIYIDNDQLRSNNSMQCNLTVTNGSNSHGENVPLSYELFRPNPNPTANNLSIKFALPKPSRVEIAVYDINGRVVKNLISENRAAGFYRVNTDCRELSSGVYILKMKAEDFKSYEKFVVTK
jgi:spore coat protein A